MTCPNNQHSGLVSEIFYTSTIYLQNRFGNEYGPNILDESHIETQYDFKIGQLYQGNMKKGFHGFRESIVPSKGSPWEVHSISRFNSAYILPKCYLIVIHKMDSRL